jgi:hypothetical protein
MLRVFAVCESMSVLGPDISSTFHFPGGEREVGNHTSLPGPGTDNLPAGHSTLSHWALCMSVFLFSPC